MSNSYKIAVLPGDGIGPEVNCRKCKSFECNCTSISI